MEKLNQSDLKDFVERNIGDFHKKRIIKLEKLRLKNVLKRKNPYLFKAKNVLTSQELVATILDAYLSSQEETIFGDFLEKLAIYVNSIIYGGWKSSAEGIDLEYDKDNIRYIVSIKSGPNWGNSSQIKRLRNNFKKAKKTLRTSNSKLHAIAINGCCYGEDPKADKGDYFKLCGQNFWKEITGEEDFYIKIIEPLGHSAKEKNDEFNKSYARMINKFTYEFSLLFCNDGMIDWAKLLKFNSGNGIMIF